MQCREERHELVFVDVLEFVNKKGESGLCFGRRVAGSQQQRREILFKVTVVGQPGFRLEVLASSDKLVHAAITERQILLVTSELLSKTTDRVMAHIVSMISK